MQKTEYKVIRFELRPKPIKKYINVQEEIGTETKTTTNFFGKEKTEEVFVYKEKKKQVTTGYSKTEKDLDQLTEAMNTHLNELANGGWKVINITPVLEGAHNMQHGNEKASRFSDATMVGWGAGWGYSLTKAMIVTLERTR